MEKMNVKSTNNQDGSFQKSLQDRKYTNILETYCFFWK